MFPGYEAMIQMVGLLVRTYGQDNTNFYDLGASTGAITLALALNNKSKNNKFIAVDNSQEMVKQCKENLTSKIDNLTVICSDINGINIENASIVVLNLTLQFIEVEKRSTLINRIYQGLNKGGILVVSEKIHFNNQQKQNILTRLD